MPSTRPDGALDIELLTTGPNAYGYGRLADHRDFAFRVRNRKARLEIYRAGADSAEPAQADVELVAERPTGPISLDSRRSITTLVRNLVVEADERPEPDAEVVTDPADGERTLRAYFVRMDAIMDAWRDDADVATGAAAATHPATAVQAGTETAAQPSAEAAGQSRGGSHRAAPTGRRTFRDYLRRLVDAA